MNTPSTFPIRYQTTTYIFLLWNNAKRNGHLCIINTRIALDFTIHMSNIFVVSEQGLYCMAYGSVCGMIRKISLFVF